MKRHCILIVDDEPNVRSSLTRLFQRSGYDTLLAENGEDAFSLLKRQAVSVVLSDYIMPGQSGVDFLIAVKERYPDVVRIILSGRADMHAVLAAVNRGVVSHFLLKPWDNDVLLETLRNAVKEHEHARHLHTLLRAADVPGDNPGLSAVKRAGNGAIILDG